MSEVMNEQASASGIAIMDQIPAADVPARSPLHHVINKPGQTAQPNPGVHLWEEALKAHLALRGDADNADFFLANRKSPWYLVALGLIGA